MSEILAPEPSTSPPENLFSLNEPDPESSVDASNSTFEKIKRGAARIFEKHGVQFRRGPGRPRKDGMPGKADLPLNAPATDLPAGAVAPPALAPETGLDPALVKRCVSAVLKGIGGVLNKLVFRKATAAGYTPPECQQLIVECSITEGEVDSFGELAEICLRKYGVGSQYAPEIGLGALALGVAGRYMLVLQTLNGQAKARLQPENAGKKP